MVCKVKDCERKIRTRSLCNMHYERLRRTGEVGEALPRKAPNGTFNVREYMGEYMKIMRSLYPDRYKSIGAMHKMRFGGLRHRILQRDNFECQVCGMTNQEHIKKWGCEITLDHIDGNGRYSNTKNHIVNNMWVLCLACHGKKDSIKYWLSKGKPQSSYLIEVLRL